MKKLFTAIAAIDTGFPDDVSEIAQTKLFILMNFIRNDIFQRGYNTVRGL